MQFSDTQPTHTGTSSDARLLLCTCYPCDTECHILLLSRSIPASLPFDPQLRPDPAAGRPSSSAAINELKRDIMRTLAECFLPLVPSLPHPKYCVMPLWACAKTQYGWARDGGGEVPLAEALLRRLGEDGCALLRQANAQGHSNLWWALSKAPNRGLVAAQGQVLAVSAECLVGMRAKDLRAQGCSNVLLACSRLKYKDARLVHHMTRCLVELLTEANAQDLSNALYALGELREDCGHVPRPEDLNQLVGAAVRRLRGWRAEEETAGGVQGISNVLLGCAKLGVEDGEAVQLLAAAAGAVARRMTEQGLANSVWALGKLLGAGGGGGIGVPTPPAPRHSTAAAAAGSSAAAVCNAVMELLQEVQRRLRRDGAAAPVFSGQSLSITLYGMALLQPYILRAAETAQEKSPKDEWAAGLTAVAAALAGECERRSFGGFVPQDIANATWALARLGHTYQGWFAAAVAAAQRPAFVSTAIPMHWTQLWSALALVRHRPPPELVDCTARAVAGHARRSDSQAFALLLWSFAVLGVWEERLAGVLLGRLAELVEQEQGQEVTAVGGGGAGAGGSASLLVEQALTNALWAVAVAGPGALVAHAREVGMLLREAARRWEQGASFISEHLHQLWQVQLELEAVGGGGPTALSPILPAACSANSVAGGRGGAAAAGSRALLAAMERAADVERQGGAMTVSSMQREVAAALRRLQLQQQQQQREPPRAQSLGPQGSEHEGQAGGGAAAFGSPDSYPSSLPALAISKIQLEPLVPALRSRVDVLVELSDGRVVAVEVDGPVHYMRNSPYEHTKDGPTALRDRQLARVFGQGNVVCVPHWEWGAVKRDREAEEAYLWGLLVGAEGVAGEEAPAVVAAWGKERPRRMQQSPQQQQAQQQEPPGTVSHAPGGGAAGRAMVEGVAGPAGVRPRGRRPRAGPQGAATGEVGHGSAARGGEAARPGAPEPQAGAGTTQRGRSLEVERAADGTARDGQVGWGHVSVGRARYRLPAYISGALGPLQSGGPVVYGIWLHVLHVQSGWPVQGMCSWLSSTGHPLYLPA